MTILEWEDPVEWDQRQQVVDKLCLEVSHWDLLKVSDILVVKVVNVFQEELRKHIDKEDRLKDILNVIHRGNIKSLIIRLSGILINIKPKSCIEGIYKRRYDAQIDHNTLEEFVDVVRLRDYKVV